MKRVVYVAPDGSSIENPELTELKDYILNRFPEYWHQGNGGATIDFYDENGGQRSLLILPNDEHGIYLKYIIEENGNIKETWLSLEDPEKLDETAECSDEWYASIGLFLPKEKAWLVVEEFCKTGERTDKIQWIDSADIPEGGNY